MRRTGRINYDMYPQYLDDFAITSDKQTGRYIVGGNVRVGLNQDGSEIWKNFETSFEYETDINQIIQDVDAMVLSMISGNVKEDKLWKKLNP